MLFQVEISRPFQVKPGRYRSRVVTRFWWLWFAVSRIKVSAYEYAETEFTWEER